VDLKGSAFMEVKKYKVIKDIIPETWMFKPSCREGDILYLRSGMLFNEDDIFICDIGSSLQKEYTIEISE
jgi:hypothetical protein